MKMQDAKLFVVAQSADSSSSSLKFRPRHGSIPPDLLIGQQAQIQLLMK